MIFLSHKPYLNQQYSQDFLPTHSLLHFLLIHILDLLHQRNIDMHQHYLKRHSLMLLLNQEMPYLNQH